MTITPKFDHLESITITRTDGTKSYTAHFDWTQEVSFEMAVPEYTAVGNRKWGQWGSQKTARRIRQQKNIEITRDEYLAYRERAGDAIRIERLGDDLGVVRFLNSVQS